MKISELLNSPEKWTQNVFARDNTGKEVCYNSKEAVCWCLLGAVRLLPIDEQKIAMTKIIDKVNSVLQWNDNPNRTHQDVRQLLDELGL